MAKDDFGEKTETPTDHRRQEARRKGNIAKSQDLNSAGLMLAAALSFLMFGTALRDSFAKMIAGYLSKPEIIEPNITFLSQHAWNLSETVAGIVLPFLAMMAFSAIFINFTQFGFLVSTEALQPKLSRLNPVEGMKRIFSIRSVVKLAVSLGKLFLVASISIMFAWSALREVLFLLERDPTEIYENITGSTMSLAFTLAIALIVLAILDFLFQKWKHEQDMMMSKQELKEEMKQMDGDPHMRQRRKEAHKKLAQARELQQVPDADVVITNPTHIAVALKYDPDTMPAPKVLAKGKGEIAYRIRTIAAQYDIPILERRELARSLYKDIQVGHYISVEMYEVFVEIMAYVYRLTGRTPPNLD